MDGILEFKGQLQKVYAQYSKYIDKIIQFILALFTFYMINHDIGFMHMLTNPVITFGLSVVCAFLPAVFTVLAAAALVLGHIYSASLGMLLVTAVVFLLMFIFYLRLAPKTAVVVLLMPLAYMLKVPAVIPISAALIGTPVYAVPAALGTISYYLIHQVKESAAAVQTAEGANFLTDMIDFAKQSLTSKEMWLFVIVDIVCMLTVYGIRRSAVAHAWKLAAAAGAAVYIVVAAAGGAVLDVKVSYGTLIIGAVAAIIVGFVLEILFFSVDYSKCENLQYEDDEYYYYVKAVPKVGVAASEKMVKRINKREDAENESEVIDSGELRKRSQKKQAGQKPHGKPSKKSNPAYAAPEKKQSKAKGKTSPDKTNTEHLLLTRSLRKDLNLDEKGK